MSNLEQKPEEIFHELLCSIVSYYDALLRLTIEETSALKEYSLEKLVAINEGKRSLMTSIANIETALFPYKQKWKAGAANQIDKELFKIKDLLLDLKILQENNTLLAKDLFVLSAASTIGS